MTSQFLPHKAAIEQNRHFVTLVHADLRLVNMNSSVKPLTYVSADVIMANEVCVLVVLIRVINSKVRGYVGSGFNYIIVDEPDENTSFKFRRCAI